MAFSSPPRWVIVTALVLLAGISVFVMFDLRSKKDEDEDEEEKSAHFFLSGKSIKLPHVRGRIDHMALDHAKHQLFVAALGNNSIEVVNTQTLQHVASIEGIPKPQGLAFSNQTLFAASGGEGALRVIECSTGGFRQQSSVTIGDDADNVRVDYGREQLLVGYGGEKSGGIFVIDISRDACGGVYVTDSSCARINDMALPAHIESFQLSQHYIYANIPLLHEIHVLDRLSGATVEVRSVAPCQSNYPMALDLDGSRLFCACRGETPTLLVFSVAQFEERRTAQPALVELARLPLHADCDDLWWDSVRRVLVASCGGTGQSDGALDLFWMSKGQWQVKTETTAPRARTFLQDPCSGIVYLAVPGSEGSAAEIRRYVLHK